jgi:hypothetical protein
MLVKTKCIRCRVVVTRAEANIALFEYIDGFYSPTHKRLGFLSARRLGGLKLSLNFAPSLETALSASPGSHDPNTSKPKLFQATRRRFTVRCSAGFVDRARGS